MRAAWLQKPPLVVAVERNTPLAGLVRLFAGRILRSTSSRGRRGVRRWVVAQPTIEIEEALARFDSAEPGALVSFGMFNGADVLG